MKGSAPQPLLGYSVGIVGHRSDRIADAGQVRARIVEVLLALEAAIDKAAASGFYPAGRQALRLVSALAEGADRIAAMAAVEAGIELGVVLPFVPSEYRKDFTDEASRTQFDELLDKSAHVLVLDGNGAERQRAYEAAGMTMLDNCDLLIAVWDGGPGRGRGGTREVIEEAARRAIPVVVIDPAGAGAMVRSGGPGAHPMRFDDVPAISTADLAHLVAAEVGAEEGFAKAQAWLRQAEPPREPAIHSAYPLLLWLARVGSPRRRGKWHGSSCCPRLSDRWCTPAARSGPPSRGWPSRCCRAGHAGCTPCPGSRRPTSWHLYRGGRCVPH